MHFDGWGVFFVHKKKLKIFRSIPQVKGEDSRKVFLEKGKVSQKVFLEKGKVLQKVFFSILVLWRKIQIVLSCLSNVEKKRGLQVQDICIGSKKHNNNWFESCALRYSLATEDRSSGKEELGRACWGGRLWSLHHSATAFAEASSFRNQRQLHILWTKTITMSGKN